MTTNSNLVTDNTNSVESFYIAVHTKDLLALFRDELRLTDYGS